VSRRAQWTLILLALALVLAGPFLLRSPEEAWVAELKLQVISPHWEGIRYEFQRGFREWFHEKTGRRIDIEWLDVGGTSSIVRYLEGEFKAHPERGTIDVVYGGGTDFYERMKASGFTLAHRLPPEQLAAIPQACAGAPVYDEDYHWYGAALSGFGVIYSKMIFEHRGLPLPKTWADLARPELATWIGAADPGMSGSVHMMFEIVLQAHGWEEGMRILTRMGANTRYFYDGSSEIPMDVARGETALGMCIDFYAWSKIDEVGGDLVGYVMPEGQTVVNADPICILKNAPHVEEAKAFVNYVMSPPGQRLWMYRRGVKGGPKCFRLARLGVIPEMYNDPSELLLIRKESNPFERKTGLDYDNRKGSKRWQVVNDFVRAAIIDTHEDAMKAWDLLREHKFPKEQDRQFGRVPLNEEELMALAEKWKDAELRERTRSEWVRHFRDQYQSIASALE